MPHRIPSEPIDKCYACRGEGIQTGPRACLVCNGVGRRALLTETIQVLLVKNRRSTDAVLVVSVRVWGVDCLDRCRELADVVAPGTEIVLATGTDPTWRLTVGESAAATTAPRRRRSAA